MIPLSVPLVAHDDYKKNLYQMTRDTGRLFLFAVDQKMEHLNDDFRGQHVPDQTSNPEYLFKLAHQCSIGAFATHLGLIVRYAHAYKDMCYVAKLNGKTNLVQSEHGDPLSMQLHTVEQVVTCKKNYAINIVGVGYTIYLGSIHEARMLEQAAQVVWQAHQYGLISILWIYPRGKSVDDAQSDALLAGAAGVGTSLGADFVKVVAPRHGQYAALRTAVVAAGNTGVLCAGGSALDDRALLENIYQQRVQGVRGVAIGRNIFQVSFNQAIARSRAIAALVYDNASVDQACQIMSMQSTQ